MWTVIKTLIVVGAFLYQFVIVMGAEAIGKETGDYSIATYEMLWLILLFFIGESVLKDED